MIRILKLLSIFVACLAFSGCLYREDGVFKQIGDSDYKANVNVMNMFAVADGRPTSVSGVVSLEDHVTPLKYTNVILKNKQDSAVIANAQTDNAGFFNMSGFLKEDLYTIEIESPEYLGSREVSIKPNKNNWHRLIVRKRIAGS